VTVEGRSGTVPVSAWVEVAGRAALRDPLAEIATAIRTPIAWTAIAPTTAELARYHGTSADGRPWSAIRKVLRRPNDASDADWRREADVYLSGVLADLPPGIVAPRLYGAEDGEAEIALWLEDIAETVPTWPLARYAIAARDLGRFNGAYLAGHALPAAPSLKGDWLAGWVAMTSEPAPAILADRAITGHELVRRAVSAATIERIRSFHTERQRLLDALAQLPLTMCHLDAWRANLMARDTDRNTETVAIDWSLLGMAPPGQEIAIFVTGARVWLGLRPEDAAVLGDTALGAYMDGLRDAGWSGSDDDVRFAYAASAALWSIPPTALWLRLFTLTDRRAWLERKFGVTLEEAAEPFGDFIEYALALGDEALGASRMRG
jgi:hypothetical protein